MIGVCLGWQEERGGPCLGRPRDCHFLISELVYDPWTQLRGWSCISMMGEVSPLRTAWKCLGSQHLDKQVLYQ